MTDEDRDYFFLACTIDTAGRSRDEVVAWLRATVQPAWADLVAEGIIRDGRALWRTDDVELPPVLLDWKLLLFAEVAANVDPVLAMNAEQDAFARRGFAFDDGVPLLSADIVARRGGSGTPLPRPSSLHAGPPPGWCPGIVHIDFPAEHLEASRFTTRAFHGPVSHLLVERGDVYRMILTEVVETRVRRPGIASWNHVSIVEGDWTGGFQAAVHRTVPEVATDESELMRTVKEVHEFERSRQVSTSVELATVGVRAS